MTKKIFLKNAFKYRKFGRIIVWFEWTVILYIIITPIFLRASAGINDEATVYMSAFWFKTLYTLIFSSLMALLASDSGSAILWRILARNSEAEERYKIAAYKTISDEIKRNEDLVDSLKRTREEIMLM